MPDSVQQLRSRLDVEFANRDEDFPSLLQARNMQKSTAGPSAWANWSKCFFSEELMNLDSTISGRMNQHCVWFDWFERINPLDSDEVSWTHIKRY